MTESDRPIIICAIAHDIYNEMGDAHGARATVDDINDIVDKYREHYGKLDLTRPPTIGEVILAMRVVGFRV